MCIKLGLEATSKSFEDLYTTSNVHGFWSGEYYVKLIARKKCLIFEHNSLVDLKEGKVPTL